jgi:hypothetical protein
MKSLMHAKPGVRIRCDNFERHSRTPEYKSWQMAKRRCQNPKAHNYQYYGARGITFSPEFNDFKKFLFEVGPEAIRSPQPRTHR